MFRSQLIILFLFIISSIAANPQCSSFINQLELNKNTPASQSPEEQEYFAFSGIKGILDLGRIRKCEESSARKYFVIGELIYENPNSKTFKEKETGICVPDYCDKQSLESYSTLLRLCRINNWDPTGPLVLVDPNETPSRGAGFYVLVAIFYLLMLLCLVSTLIQNKSELLKMLNKDSAVKATSPSRATWLFKSFDVVANGKSFYKTAQESGQSDHLAMFGFVRTCCMLWIASYDVFSTNLTDYAAVDEWPNPVPFVIKFFLCGSMANGIFFWMGGFLAAYTLAIKASRDGISVSKYFSDFFHRLLKLCPGTWMAFLLYVIVVPGMMKGPLANRYRGRIIECKEKWVPKAFMVDNILDDLPCASWTWYLGADYQIYLVVILVVYLYVCKIKNSRRLAYLATFILTAFSLGSGFWIIRNIGQNSWYKSPVPRAVQVLIGVFFGFQYYEYSKLKLTSNFCAWCEKNIRLRFASMIVGLACIIISILNFLRKSGDKEYGYGVLMTIGTALFFVPLANNCSSILKQFMNLRIFQVFGKLGFGFYLLNFNFVHHEMAQRQNLYQEYHLGILMYSVHNVIVYGLLCALLYHFALEKPLLNIEAHFSKRKTPIKPKVVTDELMTSKTGICADSSPLTKTPDDLKSPIDQAMQEPNQNGEETKDLENNLVKSEKL